jgi:cell division protein FtsL
MTVKLAIGGGLFVAVVVYGVFAVKHEVRQLERELAGLRQEVQQERHRLQVLRADWAYLTRPERLAEQAGQLELAPARPDQIMALSTIPDRLRVRHAGREWPAALPSGGEIELRLKPLLPARHVPGGRR